MKYKNIVFDFGNVIGRFDGKALLSEFCPSEEELDDLSEIVYKRWAELDAGTLDYDSYINEVIDQVPEHLKDCIRISTHILTKRMTGPLDEISAMCADFNSHPHEEDDGYNISLKSTYTISTHILTKRMTAILNKNNLFKIAYYINNKHFISIVDIFFHFHIYF